jgi:hypothetical protein
MLAKALGGAPIYITPGAEKRTWFFLGLASYEGVLRGAVRPGAYAIQPTEVSEVSRGAVPAAVREALVRLAGLDVLSAIGSQGAPLPTVREADGTSRVDWKAALAVPSWACGRALSKHPRLKGEGKRAVLRHPPIAGGSDAPEFNVSGSHRGPHVKRSCSRR